MPSLAWNPLVLEQAMALAGARVAEYTRGAVDVSARAFTELRWERIAA